MRNISLLVIDQDNKICDLRLTLCLKGLVLTETLFKELKTLLAILKCMIDHKKGEHFLFINSH